MRCGLGIVVLTHRSVKRGDCGGRECWSKNKSEGLVIASTPDVMAAALTFGTRAGRTPRTTDFRADAEAVAASPRTDSRALQAA